MARMAGHAKSRGLIVPFMAHIARFQISMLKQRLVVRADDQIASM